MPPGDSCVLRAVVDVEIVSNKRYTTRRTEVYQAYFPATVSPRPVAYHTIVQPHARRAFHVLRPHLDAVPRLVAAPGQYLRTGLCQPPDQSPLGTAITCLLDTLCPCIYP